MGTSAAARAKLVGKPMEPTGELAAIFQVKEGHEKQLRVLLERIAREPLAQPRSTESATGRLHEPRFRLLDNDAKLLFNTGCDGWDPCVGDLLRRNAAVCSALFVHLEGAPEKGINDPAVKTWILTNQVTATEDLGFPTAAAVTVTKKTGIERALEVVERVGNKVPHPVVIFILLIAVVIVLSLFFI